MSSKLSPLFVRLWFFSCLCRVSDRFPLEKIVSFVLGFAHIYPFLLISWSPETLPLHFPLSPMQTWKQTQSSSSWSEFLFPFFFLRLRLMSTKPPDPEVKIQVKRKWRLSYLLMTTFTNQLGQQILTCSHFNAHLHYHSFTLFPYFVFCPWKQIESCSVN